MQATIPPEAAGTLVCMRYLISYAGGRMDQCGKRMNVGLVKESRVCDIYCSLSRCPCPCLPFACVVCDSVDFSSVSWRSVARLAVSIPFVIPATSFTRICAASSTFSKFAISSTLSKTWLLSPLPPHHCCTLPLQQSHQQPTSTHPTSPTSLQHSAYVPAVPAQTKLHHHP